MTCKAHCSQEWTCRGFPCVDMAQRGGVGILDWSGGVAVTTRPWKAHQVLLTQSML